MKNVTVSLLVAFLVGCPSAPKVPVDQGSAWEAKLGARPKLEIKENGSVSIKRDVHSFVIDEEASKVADAFHKTMIDPNKRFGLIHLMRIAKNVGKPFTEFEKFQGRYAIEDGLSLKGPFWESVLRGIEDKFTSDYGIIQRLNLQPKPGEDYLLEYDYLEGSPIAGSSTFTVHALGDKLSRLTQVFVYQECDPSFTTFFSTNGLKLHDQVVYSQARQTAESLHAKIVETDMPVAYQVL
jgi:hypothetical protein